MDVTLNIRQKVDRFMAINVLTEVGSDNLIHTWCEHPDLSFYICGKSKVKNEIDARKIVGEFYAYNRNNTTTKKVVLG